MNNENIQKILDSANIGIWSLEFIVGKEPRMYANDSMLRLLQLPLNSSPEKIFKIWYENIPEESLEIVKNGIEIVKNDGSLEIEYFWNSPTIGKTYVRCNGRLDKTFTRGIKLFGYHQDITEIYLAKKEKERFHQMNEDILHLIGTLYDGIYRIDLSKGEFTIIKSFLDKRYLGKTLSHSEFIELFSDFFNNGKSKDFASIFSIVNLKKIFENKKENFSGELKKIDKFNSELLWFEYTISPQESYFDDDFLIVTFKNITSKKTLEERDKRILKEAYISANQANQAKSSFLSRMSHDIRTPMNAIIGMTRMALSNLNDTSKVKNCLNKIDTAGQLLLNIINQVLDMTKIEINKYDTKDEVFKLKDFMENLINIYQEAFDTKHQSLIFDVEKIKNDSVCTDIIILQRILSNLISNAIKYTPDYGKVEITVDELPCDKEGRKCYQFIIKDNGIGISQNFLKKIYEPFSREINEETKNISGTGLGLSIVRNLVSLLNGNIYIESHLKEGTTVYLTLELQIINNEVISKIKDNNDELSLKEINLKNKKILIAEDNEINREIICDLLSLTGAEIVQVENGLLAMEEFKNSQIDEYDLILMDIQMPVMNGYIATKKIRSLDRADAKKIFISAMTANSFSDDIQLAKNSGMNDHISKPIDIPKLIKVLKSII